MSTITWVDTEPSYAESTDDGGSGGRMYAVAFDLDTNELSKQWNGNSPNYAYQAIANFLKKRGFEWKQGSVYFGDATMDPVKCVLAVQDLSKTYAWFNPQVVRDIRMLRIEENNDLNPVLQYVQDNLPPLTLPDI